MNWQAIARWLFNRLKEPTSWAGIVGVITGLLRLAPLDPDQMNAVTTAGASVAAAILLLLPNSLAKKTIVRLPDGSTIKGEHTTEAPDVVVHGQEVQKAVK